MKKTKVTIVGGGVSGLACGIFCQKYGFETTIFEKNNTAGGNLTGWHRNGCYIDNCIHWLNGSKDGTNNNLLFKQIGAIDQDTQFHQSQCFYVSEHNNQRIGLNMDIEKTLQNMLECCPQDTKQIKKFVNATKICRHLNTTNNCFAKLLDIAKLFCLYGTKTLGEVANDCQCQLFKNILTDYILDDYSIYVLLLAYSAFTLGDGKVLADGSLQMANRIAKYFQTLGGKLILGTPITSAVSSDNKITLCSNDQKFETDITVFTCDPKVTFEKILNAPMPQSLQKLYDDRKNFPIVSSFHVAFDVALPKVDIPDSFVFDCPKIQIANKIYSRIMVRNYDFGKNYAPDGHCVLQIFLLTKEKDYDFFAKLSKQEYQQQKNILSQKLQDILEEKFNFLKGKTLILDCWTPLTYTRYFDSYKGSYMSFGITKKICLQKQDFQIKPYKNMFFATQWQTLFGGLPNALKQGKNCADFLNKQFD